MTVVPPIDIFNTVEIDYNTVTSPDASLPEWDELKADYKAGAEVKVTADRKKYRLTDDDPTVGVAPSVSEVWKGSPLAEYAMFDYDNEYPTELETPNKFTIPDANIIDTLYFQDIDGEQIIVELLDSNNQVLETITEDIYDWQIDSFFAYLFPSDPVLRQSIQFDFVDLELDKLRVTITKGEHQTHTKARFGMCGYKQDTGIALRDGIGFEQSNFYATERDAWGNLVSQKNRVIVSATVPVLDYNDDVDKHANLVAQLFGTPNLWIADDSEKEHVRFNFMNMFAVLLSNSIVPDASVSKKILKLEGK